MPVKLTIKAKDFICIYTSGAKQFKARRLSPPESGGVHARPCGPDAGPAGGWEKQVFCAPASEAPSNRTLPLSLKAV